MHSARQYGMTNNSGARPVEMRATRWTLSTPVSLLSGKTGHGSTVVQRPHAAGENAVPSGGTYVPAAHRSGGTRVQSSCRFPG